MPIYLFKYYIIHFEYIFPFLNKGDYLARIKVLIYFYHYYDEKNLIENPIIDIYEENNNYYKNYKPFFNAFELFFNILDSQREGCPFYQAIHQFNGLIKTDLITGKKMYSGAINSLKDIKMKLIKRINRFCVISHLSIKTEDDEFFPKFKIIVLYPNTFLKNEVYKTKNIDKKLQILFLFLIFHEVYSLLKTNINNVETSSGCNINSDLNLIFNNLNKADSEFIFEHILTNNYISLQKLINAENLEDLFDSKYYIKENFLELKNKLNEISPNIFHFYKSIIEEKMRCRQISKEEKKLKELHDYQIKLLEEADKNLDKYGYHQLYPLFKIPDNMSREKFNDILKNNRVYKKFLEIAKDNKKY